MPENGAVVMDVHWVDSAVAVCADYAWGGGVRDIMPEILW